MENLQEKYGAGYTHSILKKEVDARDAEIARLTKELEEARERLSEYGIVKAILSDFRLGNRLMDVCPSCGEITEWFRQSTDDGGGCYCTVCGFHRLKI